jgi:hypothetical protein
MKVELIIERFGSILSFPANDLATAVNYALGLEMVFNMDLLSNMGLTGYIMITGVPSKMNADDFVVKED